jgi:hypothetical protein
MINDVTAIFSVNSGSLIPQGRLGWVSLVSVHLAKANKVLIVDPTVERWHGVQDIVEFIFFPVINEACRVVEERIVDKPSDLDVAAVLGMGFPPYRGGLIKFADLAGPKHIVQRLEVRHAAHHLPRCSRDMLSCSASGLLGSAAMGVLFAHFAQPRCKTLRSSACGQCHL